MFQLRELEYFLDVVETGSISGAARKRWVSQPAVSKSISGMERTLGTRLFERSGSGIQLTPVGDGLVPIAKDLVERLRRAESLARTWAEGELQLRVACPATTSEYVISQFIADGAPIDDIIVVDPGKAYAELRTGADLAVSTWEPPSFLESLHLMNRAITVQAPAPLGDDPDKVDITEIGDELLLIPGHGSAVERQMHALASTVDLDLTTTKLVSNGTLAQALASSGRGIAVVVEHPRYSLSSQLLTVSGDPLLMHFYAAWDRYHYAAEEIAQVAERFRDWLKVFEPSPHPVFP